MNSPSRPATDSRKQAVSIRMSRSDVRHIKHLAERLGARDSDVIRFAIKLMLAKLAPLQDLSTRGRGLVPVLLESGPELMRHFELDAARLSSIINDGVEPDRCVDPDDVQLIAMSGIQRSYVQLRVAGFRRALAPKGGAAKQPTDETDLNGAAHGEEDPLENTLRQYLYQKYLFEKTPDLAANRGGTA